METTILLFFDSSLSKGFVRTVQRSHQAVRDHAHVVSEVNLCSRDFWPSSAFILRCSTMNFSSNEYPRASLLTFKPRRVSQELMRQHHYLQKAPVMRAASTNGARINNPMRKSERAGLTSSKFQVLSRSRKSTGAAGT